MTSTVAESLDHLAEYGYVMLRGACSAQELEPLAQRLSAVFESESDASILRSRGRVYGSRNLLQTLPEVGTLLSRSPLNEFTTAVLGEDAGIVRALYFDKPPDRSWSLPWHKDRTIAVKRNDLPSELFQKPTVKAGVPHVEAPLAVLERMLTIRVHLDAMNDTNGPLYVVPGSHQRVCPEHQSPIELHAEAGDVLAMRPLLTHSSTMSKPGSALHRRVIHIEAAANVILPDGYEWFSFISLHQGSPRK